MVEPLRRWRRTAVGALAVGLLVGCGSGPSGSDGSTSPSVDPSVSASPSASGTPSLSPDELYAEAERVYRLYFAELVKLESAGGADHLPPIMSEYVTGAAYSGLEEIFQEAKKNGTHYGPGEITRLTAIAPQPLASDTQAVVGVQSCNDATGNTVYDGQGNVIGQGHIAWRRSYFQWVDNKLKIFANQTKGGPECPIP